MGDLFWNKVFGALGGTFIAVIGLKEASHMLVHEHEIEQAAYVIEVPEDGGAAPVEEAPVDVGAALAAANPTVGDTFAHTLCGSCHTFDEGGATLTGPNLYGVVDRPVASHEGFTYTPAMQEHGGDWTYQRLWDYLAAPQKVVPGTAMTFAGLPREDQRANVIAYLGTLSHDPVPYPAPLPPPAPAEDAAPADDAATADAASAPAESDEDAGVAGETGSADE
jgi:cytochrome c